MKNILLLYVDDLRVQLGCYGLPGMHTPNLDRLAGESTLFERAYCQVPVSGPSRASALTGLRPREDCFRAWDARAEVDAPGIISLPGHFRNHGYATRSIGKVFHHLDDHEDAWSEGAWIPPKVLGAQPNSYNLDANRTLSEESGHGPPWECAEVEDSAYGDGKLADQALQDLDRLAAKDAPFFLSVGFLRPHLPFTAPKRYWDLYDPEDLTMASHPHPPRDAPGRALPGWHELRNYVGMPKEGPVDELTARQLVHGYCAATSYMDSQVGRVLEHLDTLGLRENTLVVFLADHGWQLGEHGLWSKHCLFEESLHCPLIIRAPGLPASKGQRAGGLVEYLDVFPTICDLAGLPAPEHLHGRSLRPLLEDANSPGKDAVFSRHTSGDSIKTERHRYSEYRDKAGEVAARMLYDHQSDPGENVNIVDDPAAVEVRNELAARLADYRAAWGT